VNADGILMYFAEFIAEWRVLIMNHEKLPFLTITFEQEDAFLDHNPLYNSARHSNSPFPAESKQAHLPGLPSFYMNDYTPETKVISVHNLTSTPHHWTSRKMQA
jgi:hypothetical protein